METTIRSPPKFVISNPYDCILSKLTQTTTQPNVTVTTITIGHKNEISLDTFQNQLVTANKLFKYMDTKWYCDYICIEQQQSMRSNDDILSIIRINHKSNQRTFLTQSLKNTITLVNNKSFTVKIDNFKVNTHNLSDIDPCQTYDKIKDITEYTYIYKDEILIQFIQEQCNEKDPVYYYVVKTKENNPFDQGNLIEIFDKLFPSSSYHSLWF
jgi:uncharacterized protein YrzB (UPF0473 family)